MSANSIGHIFKFSSFGESHGPAMGVLIEGCPAGLNISIDVLERELDRRRPGRWPWTSSRKEPDKVEILSGVFEGKTLGTPLAVVVHNRNQRSQDYDQIKSQPRPGHSEDLWKLKFGHYDHRGGGRSSGRETLGRVIAGSFARMLIKELCPQFKTMAFVRQIGDLKILPEEMEAVEGLFKNGHCSDQFSACFPHKEKSGEVKKLLLKAKEEGESYGSLLELWLENLPQGLGQPLFHKFASDLAQGIMSLGAVSALEMGLGRDSAKAKGTQFHSLKENYGGLRGGMTTGDRLFLKVAFKPPSSLGDVSKKGRHDPCIGPRAVPVLEAIACLVTANHLLWNRLDRL